MQYPAQVTYYAAMGIQAARRASRMGGAWRLYVMGKALDVIGLGMVRRDDLRAYALSLGLSPRTWQRWITEARNNDLVRDIQKNDGDWWLLLPSPARAALAMGLHEIGNRKTSMGAAELIGAGWKARVWGSYEAMYNGQPVTREHMQKAANVSASTQRYRDNQSGVKRVRSYAKTTITKDNLPGLREYGKHKGLFVTRDGFVSWRLPNSYIVDFANRGNRGRARKANAALKRLRSLEVLSLLRQDLTSNNEPNDTQQAPERWRLFNGTSQQFTKTRKRIRSIKPTEGDVYAFPKKARTGALMWEHAEVSIYVQNQV